MTFVWQETRAWTWGALVRVPGGRTDDEKAQ